jgi:pimeloyl-ACP methyl ester carboxylesterase
MLKKLVLLLALLVVLLVIVMLAWYRIDGQPLPEARQFLDSADYTATQSDDGSLMFMPAHANGHGLVIMHGALIKPMSYAKTAAFFAHQGYTVFLPRGALRLSIAAVDGAAARMESIAVRDWYVIGHSMGGFSSLELISRHKINVLAVALWAAAMPGNYSTMKTPMIFLWGDRDQLLPAERFAQARSNLPPTTRYVTLPGGNHREFAMYSHQYFDGVGTLGWQAQIDQANRLTADFFAEHAPAGG